MKKIVLNPREREIFNKNLFSVSVAADRMFGALFIFQYFLGVVLALVFSPLTWRGDQSAIHPHVFAAVVGGAVISSLPIYLAFWRSGLNANRYVVAIAQMAFSVLLIHLTNGRIETHFHVFVSLAFLAVYRDVRPVLLATVLTALDHLIRGIYWPESVYGVLDATPWRALEHSAWVIFEDVVLFYSISNSLNELKNLTRHQSDQQTTLETIESMIDERTKELEASQKTVIEQQQVLVGSAKMSALGEMAGGIAHEINTPLSLLHMKVEELEDLTQSREFDRLQFFEGTEIIRKTIDRIAKIVKGLKSFARDGKDSPATTIAIDTLVEDTLSLCRERFANHGVSIKIEGVKESGAIQGRAVELSQVLLNLLNNSFDAIKSMEDKWVRIEAQAIENQIVISVTDSGSGIPENVREKMMQPFFTTKKIGEGTGLGLSISRGIAEAHHGKLEIDTKCPNTRFVLTLPREILQNHVGKVS